MFVLQHSRRFVVLAYNFIRFLPLLLALPLLVLVLVALFHVTTVCVLATKCGLKGVLDVLSPYRSVSTHCSDTFGCNAYQLITDSFNCYGYCCLPLTPVVIPPSYLPPPPPPFETPNTSFEPLAPPPPIARTPQECTDLCPGAHFFDSASQPGEDCQPSFGYERILTFSSDVDV